jgi:hypothetical protein
VNIVFVDIGADVQLVHIPQHNQRLAGRRAHEFAGPHIDL